MSLRMETNWKYLLSLSHFQNKLPFCSSHFYFLVFGHSWQQSYKKQKYFVIFVYILQGKMQGKMQGKKKKRKENHANEVTKIPKDENMGWTKYLTVRL